MASLEDIRRERLKKIELLRERGIDPYPVSPAAALSTGDASLRFAALSKKKSITLAGRIRAIRGQGAVVFFDIDDGSGAIQALIKKGELSEEAHALFTETADMGDFVEVRGKLFLTKRREKTVLVAEWRMIAKSLRPLPDKWHGLQDVEERFRRRYLDLLMSSTTRQRFETRTRIIHALRSALVQAGYTEVETPMLHALPGGATAEPFTTHHRALDQDLYLRIAPELYLKMLLVGGFRKVFELGRNFRNEGIDVTHNPEFTMLEFYESMSDATKQRVFCEKLMRGVVRAVYRKGIVPWDGSTIDFTKKFAVIPYFELLKRHALIVNPQSIGREELRIKANQFGVGVDESDPLEKIMDNIYKKVCKPKLIQPTFIIDYPRAFSPLAKRLPENPELIDRFQLVVGGLEIVNAFAELNDPLDQRARFEEQDRKRAEGARDIAPSDESFLEAMEYGMPPAGGVGVGVDRLVMLLTDTQNIREVILFPVLRSKNG